MARVLIVEDEPLISMMLKDWLVELGHLPVGPAGTASQALALVQQEAPDCAIVDYHLRSETAEGVATALVEKKIPFALASGGSIKHDDQKIDYHCTLAKPYDYESVRITLENLVAAIHAKL